MSSSPRTCSSTKWSARTRTAASSASTARPESASRVSGIAHAISARKSALPPPSTRPRTKARCTSDAMGPLGFTFLITVAVGGVAYVFLYPLLSGEKRVEQRMRDVSDHGEVRRTRKAVDPASNRRQAVEDTLKQ